MMQASSKIAEVNGAELEYWDFGSGPAMVFIHGGMGAECFAVLRESALTSHFRLIHFQRRGYGRSTCPELPVSVEQHAYDCQALLQHLDVKVAHVVGQSFGGAVSLQLTLDAPNTVRSLTVLEAAVPSVLLSSPDFAKLGEQAIELYQSGKRDEAVACFGRAVVGDEVWSEFSSEWLDSWTGDAVAIFEADLPALGTWNFGRTEAEKISQPTLNLCGASSPVFFKDAWETLSEWLPNTDNQIVTDASHTILQMNPESAAQYIANHAKAHPIAS